MQYYNQLYMHKPEEGIFGDCYRTAIGCLLNKKPSEVPHFYNKDPEQMERDTIKFLEAQGYSKIEIPFDGKDCDLQGILNVVGGRYFKGHYWMLSGISNRGFDHVVICKNSEMIHDPHPSSDFIERPCTDGYWYCELIFKPLG